MDEDLDLAESSAGAPVVPAISGELSAAILMMLLEDDDATAILQHLAPDEVKALGKGMFEASSANENDVERALESFVSSNRDLSALAVGAPVRIREMMHKALGNVRAGNILSEIEPQSSGPSLDILRWMDVASISELVASEHPQVAAVILSVLTPEVSAQAIAALDEATQTDLLFRSANLSSISADAIEDLEAILINYTSRKAHAPDVSLGGRNEVARIVKNLPRPTAEKLLRALRKKDRLLADAIEEEMFVFDDLAALDAKTLGTILRNVDSEQIGLAVKGASELLGEKMLSTLSARAAQTIRVRSSAPMWKQLRRPSSRLHARWPHLAKSRWAERATIMSDSPKRVSLLAATARSTGFRTSAIRTTTPQAEIRPDEYARGLADGQEMAEAAFDAERLALQKLLANAQAFQSEAGPELSLLLRETVVRLVGQITDGVTIDEELLNRQIARAVDIITEADEARQILLHPDDAALVGKTVGKLAVRSDPSLSRATIRIECSQGWIEHGVALGIERLREALHCEGMAA